MISTIVSFFLVLVWIIGMATAHTLGGLIHVLPIIAFFVFGITLYKGINNFHHIDFGV